MSNRGSPYLRHAPKEAASVAIRYGPDQETCYQTKREQGRPHGALMGGICRKLPARIYVILGSNVPTSSDDLVDGPSLDL